MKKLLSIVLCLLLTFSFISLEMSIKTKAVSYDQICANETWRNSWNGSKKYVYLSVDQTGYYDLNITDFAADACVKFSMNDLDLDNCDYWYATCLNFSEYIETYHRENIYLIKNHLYQIEIAYGEYNDNDYFENFYADLSIQFNKTNYSPLKITLNTNNNLFIDNTIHDWLEIKTSSSGDYVFTSNDYADFNLYIYEKATGNFVKFTYFDFYKSTRLKLKANTEYIIETSSSEENSKLIRFNISKAPKDISKINIVGDTTILADDGYFYDDYASFYSSDIQDLYYKVNFSNGTTETLSYEDLRENGVIINDITYNNKFYEYEGEKFFKAGKQPVIISYMNSQNSTSYINITTYLDWCSNLNIKSDFDNMWIEYEDNETQTYFWRIKPDQTNLYGFYSSYWDELDILERTIFDENNNIIPADNSVWCLEGGKEYALRVKYRYAEYCYSDINFWLEAYREHTHTRKIYITPATTSKDGIAIKKCTACGNISSQRVIKRIKSISLTTSTYLYNGKVRTPGVIVKDSTGKVISSKYYTVSYSLGRKNVGTYKVTVKFKGDYSGSTTLNFTIVPSKTTVSKLTAGKRSIAVNITKNSSGITGYQIQYSTNKSFTSAGRITLKGYKTTKYTLKNLKAKRGYYVRVRTYKTVNGKHYYSPYSTYKYIKTK